LTAVLTVMPPGIAQFAARDSSLRQRIVFLQAHAVRGNSNDQTSFELPFWFGNAIAQSKEVAMFRVMRSVLGAICFLIALAVGLSLVTHSIALAQSSNLIWSQVWDGQSIIGPSMETRAASTAINIEIADDFDIGGTIQRVVVSGYRDMTAPSNPVVYGAKVRFYEWLNGQPGALQAESFIASGDPALVYDPVRPAQFDITLPTPFQATGRHFISVQVVMDAGTLDGWYWESANSSTARGASVFQRNNLAGSIWSIANNSDGAFQLYGTVTAAPRVDSLSATTLDRSGRLRIFGEDFDGTQGVGKVLIDGLPAFVTQWSGVAITAYVPEDARVGAVPVQVVTAAGASNTLTLNVTARQSSGQVKWRFQMDAMYGITRPAIASDGTIYAVDVSSHLYALAPDGGLKWLMNGAGNKGVDVGPDGTIYTGDEGQIIAINPNGTVKWTFNQNPGAMILLGPNVGPDGNIYAVATQGIGVFSLTPLGSLRWAFAEPYDRPPVDYQQIVFGPNGSASQLYFHANDHLSGVDLSGQRRFAYTDGLSTTNGDVQPMVGPDGTIYTALFPAQLGAFDPNGNLLRTFFPTGVNDPPLNTVSAPEVGPDGVIYVVQNLSTLRAFNPNGTQRWVLNENTIYDFLNINAQNSVLFVGGRITYGSPGFFEAIGMRGSPQWKVQLPFENGAYIIPYSRARFSADGQTAYAGTAGNGYATDPYSYLYALATGAPAGPSLSTLTLSPTSVSGGSTSQGTVTLTGAAPSGGSVVTLASSNTTVATVPSSVTIPAGASSATFTVATNAVNVLTNVVISAVYGGVSQSATLTVTPPSADTITISLAQYWSSKKQLRVSANSTSATATLKVYVTTTGQFIGTLTNNGGKYSGQFSWPSNPQNITVRSSLGGSATKAVTTK